VRIAKFEFFCTRRASSHWRHALYKVFDICRAPHRDDLLGLITTVLTSIGDSTRGPPALLGFEIHKRPALHLRQTAETSIRGQVVGVASTTRVFISSGIEANLADTVQIAERESMAKSERVPVVARNVVV
jgi:hypothetical protein